MNARLQDFYLTKNEPVKSCLLALRDMILSYNPETMHVLKYGMPFFCYKGKMFCYLWIQKTSGKPYLGIVEGNHFDHAELIKENRSRMKILLVDADSDLPVTLIHSILEKAIGLYESGTIKIR